MKSLKPLAALVIVVILVAIVSAAAPVDAQARAPGATNIQVVNGHNPGEVIITWNAAAGVSHYRIGYVNLKTDYPLAKASRTGNWREAFVYVDVEAQNFDQTVYTIRRLEQGANHAFAVLTNNGRYGQPTWPSNPDWVYLTVRDRGGTCPTAAPAPSPPSTPLSNEELLRRVKPALAQLLVTASSGETYSGTGFVVRSDGLVVTNRHVVHDVETVTVRMLTLTGERQEFTGRVLGRGILADLAVIKLVSNRTFATLPLGNSDAVAFGDEITAWGYPYSSFLGTDPTITRGVISSPKRIFEDTNYVQTDAAINPGNSGGPVVDRYGSVIGVNTFGLANADGQPIPGISLAIASNEVQNRLDTLESGGPSQATYRNLRFDYDYRIGIPKGWYLNSERETYSSFFPYGGRRFADIGTYDFIEPFYDKSSELSLLADFYWDELLPAYALENYHFFRPVSKSKVNVAGNEFYRLEYRVRYAPEFCVFNVVEMVSVSSSFPNNPHGFVTGSAICEDSLGQHAQERQNMLNSFRP